MKAVVIFLVLFLAAVSPAQNAADYFPSAPGYKWKFNVTPLDSLNNPVTSLAYIQLDSFALSSSYQGRNAEVVLSKTGTETTINLLPYTDTSYYDMDGTNGWTYFSIGGLDSLVSLLDSGLGATFIQLLESFENWYSVYRFAQNANTNYDIFSFDTTITYNGTPLNMRFKMEGRRYADETIQTAIGDFTCKKFRITSKIIYLPLPIFPITIVEMGDTSWAAPGNWIVKRHTPSTNVDLSFFGGGSFFIPGIKYDIAEPSVTGLSGNDVMPETFSLYQNYPNPFNPVTTISYYLPVQNHTSLKIFDILGNEAATLADEVQDAGFYEVKFNAHNLASGIYYYRLTSGSFSQVRSMVLTK